MPKKKEDQKAASPAAPVEQKIEIPSTDVESLIAKAKAEKSKPIVKKDKDKPKRGRPKKKAKPTEFDSKKYSSNQIARTLNSFLVRVGNGMIGAVKKAPLSKEEKMTDEDCEIGEALCYAFEYYGFELGHPLVVLFLATGMYGWAITDKMLTIKEEKESAARAPATQ